ncbi:hypothetical protein CPU12_01430 [Malaciobacter molluscorum LMG 25693]|uniref:Ankyrin domain-containing protein n=1 Tax=Malaciobacter molluscorum LMG 25693 TaxID=870501 RepID=A0A2G1DLW0_9BACT|nr:ankyrin repeat domain-containing protein [Malaciobacter molluscorum]AXX92242.1 ankyrin domain-containing protein [Malaciobacter molluscorum LMG 25693]PHO19469.1 hypothetical protein CPU12_01430 [Malaciobacter molluscorum LMG 25693]
MSFFKKFLSGNSEPTSDELIDAIKSDNVNKVIKILPLEDINKEDNNFETPINFALKFSSLKVLKYLLENNATLEETIDGQSIITYLISKKASLEMIKYMHEYGASTESKYGSLPLEMAFQVGSPFEVFEYIFKNFGTSRTEDNKYLIHDIVDSEIIDSDTKGKLLTLLVEEYDFDINEEPGKHLHISSKLLNNRNHDLLKVVIKLGAKVNSIAEFLEERIGAKEIKKLLPYILKSPQNKMEYITCLLDFKSYKEYIQSLDTAKDKGLVLDITLNKSFHDKEKIELLKLILEKQADINELSNEEHPRNALWNFTAEFAIGKNTLLLDFLIDSGCTIETEKHSALFIPISDNDLFLVEHLLKKGANVNFVNYFDNTALNYVIWPKAKFSNDKERIEMLKLLLDYGVDINIPLSHYKDSPTNNTSFFEAAINVCGSEFIDYIIDRFPDFKATDACIRFAIENDLNLETSKKIISKNPYVLFENEVYCKLREKSFDEGILYLALLKNKEDLANFIMDNFPDVKSYCDTYPLVLTALYKEFSFDTIKKLIAFDKDINRLYYCESEGGETYSLVSYLLDAYGKDLTEDEKINFLNVMIENGVDLSILTNSLNPSNQSLNNKGIFVLHAVYSNTFENRVIDLLLENGIDPYEPVANLNESQMHTIINRYRNVSDEKCLQYLEYLEQKGYKIDLEHRNTMGTDILLGACMMNRPKTLKWIIDKGANIHVIGGFDNSPALHKSISNYSHFIDPLLRAQTVKVLIDAGCDIEQIDSEQFTPLMSAANYGCFEVARVLVDAGANINFYNEAKENIAHRAIMTDVEAYDDKENSNLVYSKILALLKDAGLDLNKSSDEVVPPLHLSILYGKKEIYNVLLQLELDLNAKDMQGRTPLMLAICYADMYYVNSLMSKGVKIDIIDSYNESIHYYAIRRENEDESVKMLKYFLSQDIEIGKGYNNRDLLHISAYYVNLQALYIIKDMFDDFNQKDLTGFTPLHWACYSNLDIDQSKRIEVVKFLIENGANINERHPDGGNALSFAVLAGLKDLADQLIDLGSDVQVALNSVKNVEGIAPEAIAYLESSL